MKGGRKSLWKCNLREDYTWNHEKLKVNRKSAHKDTELRMHPYLGITINSMHTVIVTGFGFAAALCLPAVCGRHF